MLCYQGAGCLGCSFCCDMEHHFNPKKREHKPLTFTLGDKLRAMALAGEPTGERNGSQPIS